MASREVTRVIAGAGDYPVLVVEQGAGHLAEELCRCVPSGALVLISDVTVAGLWTESLRTELEDRGRACTLLTFSPGESAKSVEGITALWMQLLDLPVQRGDTIVAVGGGVTGDLAGFAAATVLRGLDCVQVATSSLAMADAAIGGKTGINMARGKNLVGSFHAPRAVMLWTAALATLPEREYASGLAEVVKSATLDSEAALAALETDCAALRARDPEATGRALTMACRLKARVVGRDEREQGERKILNFGHTFAHAIEHAKGFGAWTHGEAVSAGMVMAAALSRDLVGASPALQQRLEQVLGSLGLPVRPPALAPEEWLEPIQNDKKCREAGVDLILCSAPGDVHVVHRELSWLRSWLVKSPWAHSFSAISSPASER